MPTLYTENSEKWKSLADIDYFTQFVKAWIPFNAWYKNYYPQLDTDRGAVDEIKSTSNKIRNKLNSLVNGTDTDSITLKSQIAKLHYELERNHIYNKFGERICFDYIVVEINPDTKHSFPKSNITYTVEKASSSIQTTITGVDTIFSYVQTNKYDFEDVKNQPGFQTLSPDKQKKIEVCYKNPKQFIESNITYKVERTSSQIKTTVTQPRIIFSYSQTNVYNFDEVKKQSDFAKLSSTQQANIEACYKIVDPRKPISLLTKDENNCIEMGGIRFINDADLLCKGIIEILYNLRNALFHGEIIPDKETKRVYEPAYNILNTLVQAL
jgi:hypothetical protein